MVKNHHLAKCIQRCRVECVPRHPELQSCERWENSGRGRSCVHQPGVLRLRRARRTKACPSAGMRARTAARACTGTTTPRRILSGAGSAFGDSWGYLRRRTENPWGFSPRGVSALLDARERDEFPSARRWLRSSGLSLYPRRRRCHLPLVIAPNARLLASYCVPLSVSNSGILNHSDGWKASLDSAKRLWPRVGRGGCHESAGRRPQRGDGRIRPRTR